jgi:SAM-dependent methyltransferase
MTHTNAHHAGTTPPDGSAQHLTPSQCDTSYAAARRWDIARPQPAFQALAEVGAIRGRVLDVECGAGEHVLMCAALGLDATGVDLSSTALDAATAKGKHRGLTAQFHFDGRHLSELQESFDTVLDRGLLVHVYEEDNDRGAYLQALRSVPSLGGRYFVLCLRGHNHGPGHPGMTPEQITAGSTTGWPVASIDPTDLACAMDPDGTPAWLVSLTRT